MILPTAEIAAMTAQEQADLVETRGTQHKESRYETALGLALLKRSNGYLELKFESVGELAEKKGHLEYRDWTQMLSVGTRALAFPELDVAFRDGRLNWSKIRAMIPLVNRENVEEWIDLATRLTSNQVEQEVGKRRDPSMGGPTQVVRFRLPCYAVLEEFTNGVRLQERTKKTLSDEECVMRLLEELRAWRSGSLTTAAKGAAAPTRDGPERSRHVPAGIRRDAMIRARFVCELCKNRFGAELHHVIPFSEGGTHALENLVVTCHPCHAKLHAVRRRDVQSPAEECSHAAADEKPRDREPVHEEDHAGGRDAAGDGGAPAVEVSHEEDAPPGLEAGMPSHDRHDHTRSPDEGAVGAAAGTSPASTSRIDNDQVRPPDGREAADDERDLRTGDEVVAPADRVNASDGPGASPKTTIPCQGMASAASLSAGVAKAPDAPASSPQSPRERRRWVEARFRKNGRAQV